MLFITLMTGEIVMCNVKRLGIQRDTKILITLLYSRTSEQRTLWDRGFCPLFRGCPLLGDRLIFAFYPHSM